VTGCEVPIPLTNSRLLRGFLFDPSQEYAVIANHIGW